MGVHRNPKSEEDLILDEKLRLARVLARWTAGNQVAKELNEIEPALVENHAKELQSGRVTRIEIDRTALFGRPEIEPPAETP